MNIQYYFRHMSSSEALKYDLEHKISTGMESLIQTSSTVRVTFSVENDQYKIHISLHARNHSTVEVEETSEDMHKSIDLALDTLHRQLSREKDKQVDYKPRKDPFELDRINHVVTPVGEDDEDLREAQI